MRYTPYSEAEIQSKKVMDEGVYIFQVLEVITTDKYSQPLRDKNGNDIAKLKLMVWDKTERERIIYTFISGDGNFAYKLRHFAKSIGQVEAYEAGTFDIDRTISMSGKAEVVIKKGNLKQDGSGEMWPDRNDIKDFIVESSAIGKSAIETIKSALTATATAPVTEFDDDIAF